jgi:hypothetical protein
VGAPAFGVDDGNEQPIIDLTGEVEFGSRCPVGRVVAPCPLYGGRIPSLRWGLPDWHDRATLQSDAPGRVPSLLRSGICAVCGATVICDANGGPISARAERQASSY